MAGDLLVFTGRPPAEKQEPCGAVRVAPAQSRATRSVFLLLVDLLRCFVFVNMICMFVVYCFVLFVLCAIQNYNALVD